MPALPGSDLPYPRFRRLARWAGLALVGGCVAYAAWRFEWTRVAAEIAQARPAWLLVVMGCYWGVLALWTVQWWLLAPRASRPLFRRYVTVVLRTAMLMRTTPMLVGGVGGVVLLQMVAGLAGGEAVALLLMDQVLAGLAKGSVLLAAMALGTFPPWAVTGARVAGAGTGVLLLVVLLAGRMGHLHGPQALVHRMARAISAVDTRRRMATGVLALAKKGGELLALLAVLRAFGVALPVRDVLLILVALDLAALLPLLPANVGVQEAAFVTACLSIGIPPERAVGMALVQHACLFLATVTAGVWSLRPDVPPPASV